MGLKGLLIDIGKGLMWAILLLLIFSFSLGRESRFIYTDFQKAGKIIEFNAYAKTYTVCFILSLYHQYFNYWNLLLF